jgi:hypothetical protein
MTEALKEKYGDDSTQHPNWDVDTWFGVVGGKLHGHIYGLGSAVDSKVKRVSGSSQSQSMNQPPGYLDNEAVQKLIHENMAELEQRYKEREEEHKKEHKERVEQHKRNLKSVKPIEMKNSKEI